MTTPGLRERKKLRTRRAIQDHALRLFVANGYDATTVEEIAAAAEISPSTLFRYFPTKEDLVLEYGYEPMIVEALETADPDLPPVTALRRGLRDTEPPADLDEQRALSRIRLAVTVPALRSRLLEHGRDSERRIAERLASRSGGDPRDLALRSIAAAIMAAWHTAMTVWAEGDGTVPLPDLIDRALAALTDDRL